METRPSTRVRRVALVIRKRRSVRRQATAVHRVDGRREDPCIEAAEGETPVECGDQVEVHTTFTDSWVSGFEIAEVIPEGYRVRRRSDKSLLPGYTSESDVRRDV